MSLKQKNTFWIPALIFSGFFAGAVLAGGLFLFTFQENKKAKAGIKKSLKRRSDACLKKLEGRLLKFQREAERLISGGEGVSPLFSALLLLGDQEAGHLQLVPPAVRDLERKEFFHSLLPPPSRRDTARRKGARKKIFETAGEGVPSASPAPPLTEELMKDFLIFADSFGRPSTPFSMNPLPRPAEEEEGWLVLSAPAQKESRTLRWAALIKNDDLFSFSQASDREALIINSQGRLFFSFHPKPEAPPPGKPVLKKLLKALGGKSGRFVRLKGGEGPSNNFFHVRPWAETNLFIISAARFSKRTFAWPAEGSAWLIFCFGLFALLFLSLLFVIRPLALVSRRIRPGKGVPSFAPSPAPPAGLFLHNPPASGAEKTPRKPPLFLSFQDLLREEERRLREKFPGFILKTRLETNINITRFYKPLKKILRELIVNGIESTGGSEIQEITVSAREEGGKFILSVQDQGPGLSPQEREKAFNLYYSTKSHLGVGLNVAQSLVSFHGGELQLSSLSEEDPSQTGLKVQVSFPVESFALPERPPRPSAERYTNGAFRQ